MARYLYISTYGCQMNVRDSEEVTGLLLEKGYALTDSEAEADVILFNTCSVREHAEDKVWSALGTLKEEKARRPELIVGVMGCMAKAQREEIFRRAPHVDFISGPAQLYEVPELIEGIHEERQPMMAVQEKRRSEFQTVSYHAGRVSALVTIMEGCDKVCSYCVVPYTRGPEVSRPAEQIVSEARQLAARGYREVMLLGQNVNSYGRRFTTDPLVLRRAQDERPRITFPDLLERVNAVEGIERIRFMTSHPLDAVEELFVAMRDCSHVCEHLHLPVQSGSDRVLERMRRGYAADEYLARMELLRQTVPGVAVTTDIIVGFPGETEEDFEATARLMEKARFDSAFIFKYSPRPFAAASRRPDDVPEEIKDRRLQILLKLQERISKEQDRPHVGQTVEVLVEEPARPAGEAGWPAGRPGMGRTRTNRKVFFESDSGRPVGEMVHVQVDRIRGHSLLGKALLGVMMMLGFASVGLAAEESTGSLQAAFLQGRYETVLAKTRRALEQGGSSHPDELLYLQGVAALKLRNLELARASLARLLADYPNSRWAALGSGVLKTVSKAAEEVYLSIQVGAFGTQANADRLKAELDRRGYEAQVSEVLMDGQRFYRVRVGRFSNRTEAEAQLQRLKADGFPGEVVG